MLQKDRAHHRRERERDERRDQHRDRHGHGELAEEPPDDAAHEDQRDKNRDEGECDRDDGEPDLPRPFERRVERQIARLDVAHDVLDHHDGVIDHESDRDGEAHERQIVDAVAEPIHDRKGADD